MKNYILLLFLIVLPTFIFAQIGPKPILDNPIIKGEIIEESTGSPLEFATISIKSVEDSTLVGGSISESNGSFKVDVDPGLYFAEIEFIGFATKVIDDIQVGEKGAVTDLGIIMMSSGGVALDAVEITAEKSELQFSLDKRIFNVGKDLASQGGSAQDLLDNIPSVSVGVEGEVELRGSGNVRILVNGRPSGLVGVSNTDGLRNIPSHLIERVEVITNPSAKYEAEGMAGIINIILKDDKTAGFNGSFEITGGSPTQYGAGANINYRKDRLNWFLNYNYRHRTGPANGNKYQEFYNGDTTSVSLQKSRRDRSGDNHSVRFGSDYFITDKQIITGAFLYRYGEDDNKNFVTYRDRDVIGDYTDRFTEDDINDYIYRSENELEEEPTIEYSLRYDNELGKDHKFNVDVSYQNNDEKESSLFNESFYDNGILVADNLLKQRSGNVESQEQYRLQLDYIRPFGDNIKTEMGALGTFRSIDNDYLVETEVDGEWISEEGLSNNFIYDENILAAYSNFGQEFNKMSYQIGLRYEYSDITTRLVNTDETNPRTYSNLFPSAFVNYKLAGQNSFQASYSRRVNRPRFWDLNPFFTFTDPRNFFSGNPNLDPEFTNSFELGHLKYWENFNIGTTVYYRHTTDLIQRIQTDDIENQMTTRIPENIGSEDNYGLEFIFAYSGLKWFRLDGSLNAFKYVTDGVSQAGEELNAEDVTITGSLNSKFSFWKNADLQLRVNYRAPRETVQGTRDGITMLNAAFSKDFLNDKMTLTLSVRDLLNSRKWSTVYETASLYQESEFQWRPRTFTATLTYRINMKKERTPGNRGNDSGDGGGEF